MQVAHGLHQARVSGFPGAGYPGTLWVEAYPCPHRRVLATGGTSPRHAGRDARAPRVWARIKPQQADQAQGSETPLRRCVMSEQVAVRPPYRPPQGAPPRGVVRVAGLQMSGIEGNVAANLDRLETQLHE